jgi:hypothetical protein
MNPFAKVAADERPVDIPDSAFCDDWAASRVWRSSAVIRFSSASPVAFRTSSTIRRSFADRAIS